MNGSGSGPGTPALPDDFGRTFITEVSHALNGAADALGELDRRAGDGDFGTNIRTALRLAERNVEADDPATYREWATCMSMAWLGVGGTSGPLLGMFFRDLAKAAEESGDGAEDAAVDAAQATAEAVAHRGRASYLKEESRGVIDPGAAAIALVIGAARVAADGTGRVEDGWITETPSCG